MISLRLTLSCTMSNWMTALVIMNLRTLADFVTWSLVSDWSIRPTLDKSHSGSKIMKRIDWFYLKDEIIFASYWMFKLCKVFYFYGSPDWKKIETVGDLMDDKVNWILTSITWPEYWLAERWWQWVWSGVYSGVFRDSKGTSTLPLKRLVKSAVLGV